MQLSKIVQSREFLGRLFGPLMRVGLQLMKHVLIPLAKSVLQSLELPAAVSERDTAIQKHFALGIAALIISTK